MFFQDVSFSHISCPINTIQDSLNGVYIDKLQDFTLVKFESKKKSILSKNKQNIGEWAKKVGICRENEVLILEDFPFQHRSSIINNIRCYGNIMYL